MAMKRVAAALLVVVTLQVAAQQPDQGKKAVVTAPKAMVSSSHPEVNRIALEVLKKGGNAIDAMITVIIAQPILEPQMSTLAGGMGALIHDARSGKLVYLDAELDHTAKGAPITAILGAASDGVPETSGRRIGIPGTVPGLRAAAERYGI
jgi:gamma-glutamyltranspeptidase/glutathione hydrolase